MDIHKYNSAAWDAEVERKSKWTIPIDADAVAAARRGEVEVLLTPAKPVPLSWFPPLAGCRLLGLACGGGQQGPIFAAAGAHVTILDASPGQLAQDRSVAQREGLGLETIIGDMADLSMFADASFDVVFNPCSNCYAPDVRPIWRESARVLCSGGVLMTGFSNPAQYIFDNKLLEDEGQFKVRHTLPYSEITDLTVEEKQYYIDREEPLMFGHTLDDQIGGQLDAGLVITGFFEDSDPASALSQHMPSYIATRALKK